MTRFAAGFILVFGELAFGGMFALAIPPFFRIERGFYKSSASVYLAAGIVTAVGLGLLAVRANVPEAPSAAMVWLAIAAWTLFCAVLAAYLFTLWTDNGLIRARAYAIGLATGLAAVIIHALLLKPAGMGIAASIAYALTAVTSSMVLGLVSGAMMFGHWYLIDRSMPVDYLRTFMRVLGGALAANLAAAGAALATVASFCGQSGALSAASLFGPHLTLFAAWFLLGPAATIVLSWMCWQTLKIPQTMAATGLLYIALMSALVGEMLGRFILFRTAVPL